MPRRHWTIVIVPSDNEGTRSFSISDGNRKSLLWTGGFGAAVVLAAAVFLFTPYATPAGRIALAENTRLRAELDGVDVKLMALADTLNEIGERDRQLRMMAGLAPDSTSIAIDDPGFIDAGQDRRVASFLPSAPARKSLLSRFGFASDAREQIALLTSRASALARSFSAVNDTLTQNLERIANTPSIMPTVGWLSSQFSLSRFHPVLHENRPHQGIDVTADMGAPIVAPASGRVKSVGYEAGYGNTFEIDHGNGIVTRFAHCSRIIVRKGQTVTRGQLIATVGNTGLTIGSHLHYEVHVNGKPVDPLRYVLPDRIAD
ncbi:MAG: M23 family metallopeptidase [Gemmatimonadetes bacterium]|nr:M23 family metallopeptidase [Gemmatimonadota bacterium]